ncbi:helix-turn-helix domain-containing protein [Siphonobacter sp. BAB-5385]|uniref:helix-turn-helix domain-containing protein n=1 Tax=Siphonobacter sp. BAB-5385 TaxID=1864822 RepID=UPI0020CC4A37|nr:helix-turn-helix domain-containing protein [Siphonobacter sp. BAB-5385]
MEEASWYLGLARSSLQKMTSDRAIPHYKPNARLVYFLRTDLDNWMLQNRVAPEQEVEQQALKHVTSKRR